jgi:hypothetical protein
MMQERILWGGFSLAIIAYLLPWVGNDISGLTMGAYDFAEWLSKFSMSDARFYNTMLSLRGQLFLLTCFVAFGAKRPFFATDWCLRFILGMLLVIAQIPALNILPMIATDINRQQQMILAVLSFLVLIVGLIGIFLRWRDLLCLLLTIVSIVSSIYALINGIAIMQDYRLSPTIGLGFLVYLLLGTLLALRSFVQLRLRQS